jgi:hypothetical protein
MRLKKSSSMTGHSETRIPNFKYDNHARRVEKKKLQQKYEKMEQLLEKEMPHFFVPDNS